MKKLMFSIVLIALVSAAAAQFKTSDVDNFQISYQTFLQNVTCTDPVRVLDHQVIPTAAIPLPGFGMNGKIAYPAGNPTWVEDMHFGIPLFRNAISNMGLDNLRFPGGTIGNSLVLYPRRLTFNNGMLQQDYYFIDQEQSDAEPIPNSQQASFFFEGSSMRNGPYMEVDVDVNVDDIQNFIDFNDQINSLLGMTEHSADESYGNGILISPMPPFFSDHENNVLRDFVSLVEENDIRPSYLLRMFDPLLFIVKTSDSGISYSPLLIEKIRQETNSTLNDGGMQYVNNAPGRAAVQQMIMDESRFEVRRQMVKYVYEYMRDFLLSSVDPLAFELFLNNVHVDNSAQNTHDWQDFIAYVNAHPMAGLLHNVELDFELGNELWDYKYYKFLAPDVDASLVPVPGHQAERYAHMCNQAITDITSIFPQARIGLVGGNKSDDCLWWTQGVREHLTDLSSFDAWVLHQYARYEGNSLPVAFSDAADAFLASPISEQLNRLRYDDEDGLTTGSIDLLLDKPIWFTEFNVRTTTALENTGLFGSWYDLMAKLHLYNQYISRQVGLDQNINAGPVSNAGTVFNSGLPQMNLDMLLMQTLRSEQQAGIYVEEVDNQLIFNFADQGLMAVLLDRLTEDGYKRALPMVFLDDSSPDVDASETLSPAAFDVGCDTTAPYTATAPKVWGWRVEKDSDLLCGAPYRYLVVNASHDCVELASLQDYNPMNVDILLLDQDGNTLSPLVVSTAVLEEIQQPIGGGFIDAGVFCFNSDVIHPDLLSTGGNILMPAYSIMILESIQAAPAPTISGITIWDQDYNVYEDIIVNSGATLTINNDATIRFAPEVGIIVKQGATLIVNGATLTRFDCGDDYWNGIDVQEGGTVLTWDSNIDFALVGINNFIRSLGSGTTAGGNISCWTTEFTDCQTAVRLRKKNGSASYSSLAAFRDCDFTWTNDLPFVNTDEFNPQPLIDASESTVQFVYCDFYNENDELLSLAINHAHNPAIYSYRTRLSVIGDDASSVRNEMSGFRHGLVVHGGRAYVDLMDFNNFRSAYVVSSKGSSFTRNHFEILPQARLDLIEYDSDEFSYKTMYGLYLESSTAYWVEENRFMSAHPGGNPEEPWIDATVPDFPYSAGLFVRASNDAQNKIYRNKFYHNDYGSIAYDNNRGTNNTTGLKFECSEFNWSRETDLSVAATSAWDAVDDWGISKHQGVEPQGGGQGGQTAGNKYDLLAGADGLLELNNEFTGDLIYFFHISEFADTDVQSSLLGAEPQFIDFPFLCPSRLGRERSAMLIDADLYRSTADQVRTLLNEQVDGGDTQELLTEVILTQYGEALELYYELSSKSPFLSEEVLIEAIQKEAELPPLLLTLILESNPHAAKSGTIQEKLDQRSIPLEEYMRDMIDQGLYVISTKEELESRLSHYENEQHSEMNVAIMDVLTDSSLVDKMTEVDQLLANTGRETLDLRYLRIELHLEEGQLTTAQALLDDIATDFYLNERKGQEYLDFQYCYSLLIAKAGNGEGSLSGTEESELLTIAFKRNSRARALAEVILAGYTEYLIEEVLMQPGTVAKSQQGRRRAGKPIAKEFNGIELFPNPASDYLVVRNSFTGHDFSIVTSDGKVLSKGVLASERRITVIDTSQLPTGSYKLITSGHSTSFQVLR